MSPSNAQCPVSERKDSRPLLFLLSLLLLTCLATAGCATRPAALETTPPSGSKPMAAGRGRSTRTVMGSVPRQSAKPIQGAAPDNPRCSISNATAGARAIPPKDSPAEAIENAKARRTLNQRANTVVRGTRPQQPLLTPNTMWKV